MSLSAVVLQFNFQPGEYVSSGSLIPHEDVWEVDRPGEGFMDDTEYFIESYSSEVEASENRIISYHYILENL
ncbi:MAG: hypothetical protein ACW97A_14395 [Candidatus Thorarchaeota archaeon]|jgi:hypothetical protein